jgi:LysM domain
MIYQDSRYADGPLLKAYNARTGNYIQSVYRQWPTYQVQTYWYEVVDGDRIEHIAAMKLGNPEMWWQIMDVNPEIINPFEIAPGTQIRIPIE